MRRQPLLLGSYVFIFPPFLSWGRCHASSHIDSQISMSLYDTPESSGCDEHQHSHWFCRSTSIELRVQAQLTMHGLVCAVLYTEQRSKCSAQKSRILAVEGEGKFMLFFFFFFGLISPNRNHKSIYCQISLHMWVLVFSPLTLTKEINNTHKE